MDREDGHTAIFTVDKVENHPKNAFPNDRVYRAAPRPEPRRITCGGTYDRHRGGYRDDTVASAHLTAIG
ncbi:hypothetical protein GT354_23620 [Streptomyces sp. SID3343]|nr:hypothetical protein [Streptomyces sp. SID3343]